MDLKEYQSLKSKVESAQRQHDRVEGALEQKHQQLEEDFGCDSLKAANKHIDGEDKEIARLDKEYEVRLQAFEGRWSGKL
jgi:archaellum component FlaC